MLVWMSWYHPNYSEAESRSFVLSSEIAWNEKTRFPFAVFEVGSVSFLGGVELNQINCEHKFANLGYWVRGSQNGRGFATAATLLAAKFGFEDLGLNRIELLTVVGNAASGRVAEKANPGDALLN